METLKDTQDVDMNIFLSTKSKSSYEDFDNYSDDVTLTGRVKYILNKLSNYEIEKDIFFNKRHNREYINLYYFKDNGADDTICLLAHHDINNTKSINANDNSASIMNLINLITKYDLNLNKNILIAFTDAEEIVDVRNNGAYRLGERINNGDFKNVEVAINLELTAFGKNIWYDEDTIISPLLKELDSLKVKIPFNDSISLRACGISSVCLGIVTDDDINQINSNGFCDTWRLCHSIEDNKYDSNDMKILVDKIYNIIKNL
jgi:hypothetical protein